MHLTLHTDYSLRVLMYLGVRTGRASIADISAAYAISHNHLVKVVGTLARLGYVETLRGRDGGLRLARLPEEIRIGQVIRDCEPLDLVECFNRERNSCVVAGACRLKSALAEATEAFLAVLDDCTLADLLERPRPIQQLLGIGTYLST